MSEFPKMLYREGGETEVFGLKCETVIAETAEEGQELLADGWSTTPFEAHGVEPPKADSIEEAPPLEVEREALSGEIAQLSKDLDTVQAERVALTEELKREREAHDATKAKLAEAEALLAEATKPVEKKKLSVKAD